MTAGAIALPELSLVFPAYDEAVNLPILLPRALAIGEATRRSFEIVIVDDGSRDDSFEIVSRWSALDPRVRGIQHVRNRGYGAALRTGLRAARGELVFFSDADLQFELSEIDRLLDHVERFEIVAGVRAPRRDPWPRRLLARVWGWLIGALFQLPVRDIDCAFKIFRREVLLAIPIESIGAFVNTEILVRARAAGFRIHQVPVTHHRRRSGSQTGAHPRVILRALIELSQLYGKIHPRRAASEPIPRGAGLEPAQQNTTAPYPAGRASRTAELGARR